MDLLPRLLTLFPGTMRKLFHDFIPSDEYGELTRTQLKVIFIIANQDQPHMTNICNQMNLEKGSLTPVVDQLIKRGLVERNRNNPDMRKVVLSLSPRGKRYHGKETNRITLHLQNKLSVLSRKDHRRFLKAIEDLGEILEKL